MSAKFTVKAASTLPKGTASWKVDLGDDAKIAVVYTNLAYALLAASISKLGAAVSEHMLGNSDDLKALLEENGMGGFDI